MKHPELLEATFMSWNDFGFLQRSHFSFKEEAKTSTDDLDDRSDV